MRSRYKEAYTFLFDDYCKLIGKLIRITAMVEEFEARQKLEALCFHTCGVKYDAKRILTSKNREFYW